MGVSTARACDRLRAGPPWSPTSLLVVTGGAVRLTGSGLGCPTWPRCTDGVVHPARRHRTAPAIEFGNRTLTFVLVAVAVATFVAAWQQRPPRPAAGSSVVLALGDPRPGRARRHHRADRPQPVGRLVPPAAVAGDHRRSRCCSCTGSTTRRPRRRPRARCRALAWATFAVAWAGALRRHRGHRLRARTPATRLAAQRARPAAAQPAARRPGVPAGRPHRRAVVRAARHRRPTPAPVAAAAAAVEVLPGRDRLRAVLHRPAVGWSSCTCSARRSWSRPRTWLLVSVLEPAGPARDVDDGRPAPPWTGRPSYPIRRTRRPGVASPGELPTRPVRLGATSAQRVSSGSSATATNSSDR